MGRSAEPLLELNDLRVSIDVRHGTVEPVQGVSLQVRRGETLGIVGESGSGKTMTALSVMGLLPEGGHVTSGRIHFDGCELTELDPEEARRIRGLDIGMVFQDPLTSLNPTLRIGDQVGEALRYHKGVSKKEARRRAVEVLHTVGMPRPEQVVDEYPHQLSGGMRQRVMIAMAVVCSPRLIIADEPTTALDVTTQRQILDLLDGLKKRFDTGVILVTHDMGVVAGRADRIAVMYAGRVVEEASAREIFANPQHQYTRSLLAALPEQVGDSREELYTIPGMPPSLREPMTLCPFLPRCPRADEVCRQQAPVRIEVGQGHTHHCHHPAGPPLERPHSTRGCSRTSERPLVMEVKGLTKNYPAMGGRVIRHRVGTVSAVADVSFRVREGETLGLVGESGCGKSTIGRLISALEPADSGSITVMGTDIAALRGRRLKALHREVQMMFQDSLAAMDPRMRMDEILTEPMAIQRVSTRTGRRDRVEGLVHDIGLGPDALDRYPHEFSGGQLQRIGLARALVLAPRLIICDEPVSALDVSVQAQVLNLMRRLQAENDLTYVFISHDLSVVRYMSDRIAVMYLGKIVETGPASQVVDHPLHPYTQALVDAIPVADPDRRVQDRVVLSGEPGSAVNPGPGCRFADRCPFVREKCRVEPVLDGGEHQVACHFPLGDPGDGHAGR